MAQDTADMDDSALDALLDAQYDDNDQALGEEIIRNPENEYEDNGSEDVSPSDDIEEGQSDAEYAQSDVGQTADEDEDPEDSLSTDEDEDGEDSDEADVDDESTDGNSEDDSEGDSESDEEPVAFQPLRADGKEYPIESMQELYSLASKGINADRKWTESAAGRKIASTLQKNGLSADDINLLVELKSGNQKAIASLLKSAKIDPLDIDVDALDGDYKAKDHSTGDFELKLDDVVARVKTQPYYEKSVDVIMKQWDESSKGTFYENPEILELLNIDMQVDAKTGVSMYDRVVPVAEKMKALEPGTKKSDLQYYQMAGAKVIDALNASDESRKTADEKKKQASSTKQKQVKSKKKSAASSRGTSRGKQTKDVTEMSDEELDALLEANPN